MLGKSRDKDDNATPAGFGRFICSACGEFAWGLEGEEHWRDRGVQADGRLLLSKCRSNGRLATLAAPST